METSFFFSESTSKIFCLGILPQISKDYFFFENSQYSFRIPRSGGLLFCFFLQFQSHRAFLQQFHFVGIFTKMFWRFSHEFQKKLLQSFFVVFLHVFLWRFLQIFTAIFSEVPSEILKNCPENLPGIPQDFFLETTFLQDFLQGITPAVCFLQEFSYDIVAAIRTKTIERLKRFL